MYRKYIIAIIVLLLSSCEKSPDTSDGELKYYGDSFEDIGYTIAQVDNGYFIGGQFTALTRVGNIIVKEKSIKKMAVIKTGTDGNTVWKRSMGGRFPAVGTKILALEDGSVVCTGYVQDTLAPYSKNLLVVKLDADGNTILEKIFKSPGNQYGTDIINTPEGFLVLGSTDVLREPSTVYTGNAAGKKDILLVRLDNNFGSIVTPFATGFIGNDEGVAIKSAIGGGYIVVGTTDRSLPSTEQAGNNIILWRIRSDASVIEYRILGGASDEYAADIEVLTDGYLVVGNIGTEATGQLGYAWQVPSNISSETIPGDTINIELEAKIKTPFSIKAMCPYKTSLFLMAGQFSTGLSARMLIFVTDDSGNMVEGKKKVIGGTGTQAANDVISDNEDNIIAVGKNSFENNSMITLYKFRF